MDLDSGSRGVLLSLFNLQDDAGPLPWEFQILSSNLCGVRAAPSNVCGFIWQAMYDRLPTHMNLWRRKVILFAVDTCCSMCSYEQETLDHLLILCPIVVSVWTTCYRWFGLNTVLPGGCRSHLQQHVSLDLNSKQNEAFRVVWFVVTWLLWLHRNYVIFNNEGRQHDSIFEGAQLRAWNLLSGRIKGFNCSIYEWLAQPICCLKTVSYTCAVIVWFLGCYSLDLLLHMLLIWLY